MQYSKIVKLNIYKSEYTIKDKRIPDKCISTGYLSYF